jgi:polysaccharide biosynthesis/export protein
MIAAATRCMALLAVLAGCASLSASGPTATAIAEGAQSESYRVIVLDAATVASLGQAAPAGLPTGLGLRRGQAGTPAVAPGDRLAIHIWEASPDALFADSGNKRTLIEATVDTANRIFVPYAGDIDVAGLRPEQIRSAITLRLTGQTIDPQVQVAVTEKAPQLITVSGAVARPGQYPLPLAGLDLVAGLAIAGGLSAPAFETDVTLIRGGQRHTVRVDAVLGAAGANIWLLAGDSIVLRHQPRSFTAFGAFGSQSRQMFAGETMSLAEAIAQTGGLDDGLAAAAGVFVFRFEPADRIASTGLPAPAGAGPLPVIYQLDLTLPDAFFWAAAFQMRDKDIVYVTNAPAADFQKFTRMIVLPGLGSLRAADP